MCIIFLKTFQRFIQNYTWGLKQFSCILCFCPACKLLKKHTVISFCLFVFLAPCFVFTKRSENAVTKWLLEEGSAVVYSSSGRHLNKEPYIIYLCYCACVGPRKPVCFHLSKKAQVQREILIYLCKHMHFIWFSNQSHLVWTSPCVWYLSWCLF